MSKPLFEAAEEVAVRIRQAPRYLLCLDFDGTLAPFVGDPAAARMPPVADRTLRTLAARPDVMLAIISGRDRSDLSGRVGIPGLIYAGNHGLDIAGPEFLYVEPTAAAHSDELRELAVVLAMKLRDVPGVIVEYKGLTLSVHYRLAAESTWDEIRRVVHATLAGTSHPFVLGAGEKVHEIRPRVAWNKGSAVTWVREHLADPDRLPIYVGDDVTDEDAFAALRDDGITVKVRADAETAARYTLKDPAEVHKFLAWFEELLRRRDGRD